MNVACVLLALMTLLPGSDDASSLDTDTIVRRAVGYRAGIQRGHVMFSVRYNRNTNAADYEQVIKNYDMYFDKKSVRSIVHWNHPAWARVTKTVVTDENFISEWSKEDRVVTGPRSESTMAIYVQEAFDPRLLGLVPVDVSLLYRSSIGHPFFFSENEHSKAIDDKLDGQDALRIDYRIAPDRRVRLWIAPRIGYGVLRLERENGTPGQPGHSLAVVSSKFEKSERGGIWFPKEVTRRQFSGDTLLTEEVIHVERVQLNTDVDPAFFSFKGLALEPGTKVMDVHHRMMIWTGSQLVDEHRSRDPSTDATNPSPRRTTTRWFWWSNGVICVVVFSILLHRSFRQAHKAQ
jgi:hypothetical protein